MSDVEMEDVNGVDEEAPGVHLMQENGAPMLSDDEEGDVARPIDEEDFPAPLILDKGKGKADFAAQQDIDNLPWVEKYRPVTLDDVVSHKDIVSTIDTFIAKNRLPHLLFYGPPGTGKTSTILAVARKIFGGGKEGAIRNNVLELNASDDRGIDVVREEIKNFASMRLSFSSQYKLIILDEADMMTQQAQAALRRIIEQYTKNVRFCIICNYVNRIIPAVQSRCTRFRFGPLEEAEVNRRLQHVVDAEKCNLSEDGRKALLKLSKGDMRRVLNVLQACHSAYSVIDESAIYQCTGTPHPNDIEEIMESMMKDSFEAAFRRISALKVSKGLALQDIIAGIYDALMTLELPPNVRVYLLDQLGQVEHRLSTGGSEKLQLTAMLGGFKIAMELAAK